MPAVTTHVPQDDGDNQKTDSGGNDLDDVHSANVQARASLVLIVR